MTDSPCARILEAPSPYALFGEVTVEDLGRAYRRMAKKVHPDACDDPRAGEAFRRLSQLFRDARHQLELERYGEAAEIVRVGTYRFEKPALYRGHVTDYYAGASDVGDDVVMKLVRHPADNRVLRRERDILIKLLQEDRIKKNATFFPSYREALSLRMDGTTREGLVFDRLYADPPGHPPENLTLYSLRNVRERYPEGIHPKDMAWMLRRVLFALGLAHRCGRVHGAMLPEHILIEPEHHGVVLIDWKHSVPIGTPIKDIPRGTRDDYPPEVLEKKPATAATDIYMAIRAVRASVWGARFGPRYPDVLDNFVRGCTQDSPALRPQDAHALGREFDELIERLWGPRRFHPFTM